MTTCNHCWFGIYVLDRGKIVQQGNFQELTAYKGLFADLIGRQMV
ncbi:MAG: hypothetical protein AAGM40_11635 [Cyanobacteria bacterium J06573_2]